MLEIIRLIVFEIIAFIVSFYWTVTDRGILSRHEFVCDLIGYMGAITIVGVFLFQVVKVFIFK